MDATANADPFVEVSATLKAVAVNLVKVAGDLRLLHMSGEIGLPAVQAALMLARHMAGVTADEARCAGVLATSPMVITAFVPALGYDRCAALMKEFTRRGERDMRAFLAEKLGAAQVDETLDPNRINGLGYR
jgi:aspartate ammonia-lyase